MSSWTVLHFYDNSIGKNGHRRSWVWSLLSTNGSYLSCVENVKQKFQEKTYPTKLESETV